MNLPLPWMLSSVAVRTAIILFVMLIGLRLIGKRGAGNMNLFDVAMVLLLGNAVQNALTYGSGSLWVGLVSAGTLLLVERLMGVLFARLPWLQRKMEGEPTVIFCDGELDRRAMKREGVEEGELLEAARSIGVKDLDGIRLAVLEPNGSISVIPKNKD